MASNQNPGSCQVIRCRHSWSSSGVVSQGQCIGCKDLWGKKTNYLSTCILQYEKTNSDEKGTGQLQQTPSLGRGGRGEEAHGSQQTLAFLKFSQAQCSHFLQLWDQKHSLIKAQFCLQRVVLSQSLGPWLCPMSHSFFSTRDGPCLLLSSFLCLLLAQRTSGTLRPFIFNLSPCFI